MAFFFRLISKLMNYRYLCKAGCFILKDRLWLVNWSCIAWKEHFFTNFTIALVCVWTNFRINRLNRLSTGCFLDNYNLNLIKSGIIYPVYPHNKHLFFLPPPLCLYGCLNQKSSNMSGSWAWYWVNNGKTMITTWICVDVHVFSLFISSETCFNIVLSINKYVSPSLSW